MAAKSGSSEREIVGLVPAGGVATRIAPLPLSKELYPIGFRPVGSQGELRPKVVCHYLLESMRLAGASKAFIVLREGKWDIPAYFGTGDLVDMDLAYLMMGLPYGPPYTADRAFPFVGDALVLFGFPDVIFQPETAFVDLVEAQNRSGAAIVLGLFPADRPQKVDMVELAAGGRVRRIVIKPDQTDLQFTWMIAAWTPVFSQFMHEYLNRIQAGSRRQAQRERHVGHVIQAALEEGLVVEAVTFDSGACLDIGTPDDLVRAVRAYCRPG